MQYTSDSSSPSQEINTFLHNTSSIPQNQHVSSPSLLGYIWKMAPCDLSWAHTVREHFQLSDLEGLLLAVRSHSLEVAELLYAPTLRKTMPNPGLLPEIEPALDRLCAAFERKERIALWGDYDVDGSSSVALAARVFELFGYTYPPLVHIPHRMHEGYGPNLEGFKKLIAAGARVIMTLDCGSTHNEAFDYARAQGVDVIVIDHHQSPDRPRVYAFVNPYHPHVASPDAFKDLAAVGVVFMFLCVLRLKLNLSKTVLADHLDLVALGTVCDAVPLSPLNRALIRQGLFVLRNTKNLGLEALCKICELEEPTSSDLGFLLGPHINAGSRISHGDLAARLLLSKDAQEAKRLANELHELNEERKNITHDVLREAIDMADAQMHEPVIVLGAAHWHLGVVGIVAGRVKEHTNKPTIVVAFDGEFGKGSARSVAPFNIGAALMNAVDAGLLVKGGGHAMAGGLTIYPRYLERLRAFMNEAYTRHNETNNISRERIFSVAASAKALERLWPFIAQLGPFGTSNETIYFLIKDCSIVKRLMNTSAHSMRFIMRQHSDAATFMVRFFGAAYKALYNALDQMHVERRFHIIISIDRRGFVGEDVILL